MIKEMSKKAVSDPKALQSIMLSLQRLMKVGIYYPSGHSIFEKAVAHFKHNIARVAAGQPTIRFAVKGNKLYLQNIPLNPKHTFVKEFKDFLNSLNITRLEIDREIHSEEIRTFIHALLKHRTEFKTAKGFSKMTLEELPHSVRLQQVEYFTSDSLNDQAVENNNGESQTVDTLLDRLKTYNLNASQINQCRNLLNTLSPDSLPATSQSGSTIPITWSDVEELIVNLIKKTETGNTKEVYNARQNLNSIASILSALEESNQEKSSLEAIDLLVSLVKGPTAEQTPTTNKVPKKQDGSGPPTLPINEIESFVQSNISPDPFKHYFARTDQGEPLTILLQLLEHKHSIQVKFRIQQMLREILTGSIPQNQLTLLISGMHHLLTIENDQRLSVALMLVIDPLRYSGYISPFTVLERLCLACSNTELKRLAPHIVNELLISGRQQEPIAFDAICTSLNKIPLQEYSAAITTPDSLAILQEGNIAQNLFYSLPKHFHSIFAPLLPAPIGKTITNLAIQGFSSSPPDNLMRAVLPFFISDSTSHCRFLFEYLMNGNQPEPPTRVRVLAGEIVTEGLANISDEQKSSQAIETTVRNMPELRGDTIKPTLKMIVEQKSMLVIPAWPSGCRKAAKEALKEIKLSRRNR